MTLPRGFKANAEREALRIRKELGLTETSPVNLEEVAGHINIKIVDGQKLVSLERFEEVERVQAFAFSAATFDIAGRKIIVTNPVRTPARTASDVAHELAHVLLAHELTEIREIEGHPFRTCKPDEEEQATAFGGTLLLPRPLLARAARIGLKPEQIAEKYAVTVEMARFRYNTTGVARQASPRIRA